MNIKLPDNVIGQSLKQVRALVLDYPDEPGDSMREGIALDFEDKSIFIQAITDTSELTVSLDDFHIEIKDQEYHKIFSVSQMQPFSQFIDKHVSDWWCMKNNQGYNDGFTIAFKADYGLTFIAMNNFINVLIMGPNYK